MLNSSAIVFLSDELRAARRPQRNLAVVGVAMSLTAPSRTRRFGLADATADPMADSCEWVSGKSEGAWGLAEAGSDHGADRALEPLNRDVGSG